MSDVTSPAAGQTAGTVPTSPNAPSDLGEVTIVREFDAPRELVFKAFVDPAQFVMFWGPTGTHVPIETVVIEPWAGGRFESVMVADDGSGEYPTKATFVEVTEPEVFAFAELELGITSTGTLTDLGGGRCRLVIHQTNVPPEYRTPEALAGFNTSLDRLAQYLATL
ncbi:SRPBCC family protein [Jatrophihabitans sp. DSM 45814]